MVTLFKVDRWKLVINEEELLKHKEFSALLDYEYNNRDKAKRRGLSELMYISLVYGFSSSIRELPMEQRKKEALSMAKLEPDYKISERLQVAIDRYIYISNQKLELRLLNQTEATLNSLIDYLKKADDGFEKLNLKPDELIKYIAGVRKGIKDLQELRKDVEDSLKEEERIYGGNQKGLLEDEDSTFD